MRIRRSNLKLRSFPTPRLATALALGSLCFFATAWFGMGFYWIGIGYWVLLGAFTLVDFLTLKQTDACTIERECENILSLGQANPVNVKINNRSPLALKAHVRDEYPIECSVDMKFLQYDLLPGQTRTETYRIHPPKRGDYSFGALNVRFTTSLGLVMRQANTPSDLSIKVYPDVLQTKKQMLMLKENRLIQMGLRQSRFIGQGQEFERLRDYVPDDSLRHVDWKATARKGSLMTREYDVERSQQIMILLDLGRSMASQTVEKDGTQGISKADCAINASVLLAHVAAQSGDQVGLFAFSSEPLLYVSPGKGPRQVTGLLEALYPLQPMLEEPDYRRNFLYMRHKHRRRALVFLFTDLIDPIASRSLIASTGLLAEKHLVVCMALADYELPAIIESEPTSTRDLFTQSVAAGIVRGRTKAIASLSSRGVIAIDATPNDLSISAVNKYLQLKREGRL